MTATNANPAAPANAPAITFRQQLILRLVTVGGIVTVGLVVALCVYLFVDAGDGSHRPSVLSADEAAEQSVRDYAASLADIYAMAAEGIERGDIKSDAEFHDYTAATEDARKSAFSTFDKSMESSFADGEWSGRSADEAAAWCRRAADGFRKVAE